MENSKELYEALKETLENVKEAFGNSGYLQFIEYAAKNNGTKNWYFKSTAAIELYEKENNINKA